MESNRFARVKEQRGIVLCAAGMENTWIIHSTSMSALTTTIHLTSSYNWRGTIAQKKEQNKRYLVVGLFLSVCTDWICSLPLGVK